MEYRYRSPIGTFTIRPADEGYQLFIDGTVLSTYPTADAAYKDITRQSTGWDEWDRLSQIDLPELEHWETRPRR